MISIVLNVYNGEKYISKCIEAVLNQTFADFELILVNDGSKDQTGRLADEWASIDNRIQVYHTKNKGLSGSRQYGLALMQGEYGIFLDCDDWIEPTWLEELYNAIIKENADLAICEYFEEYKDGDKHVKIQNHTEVIEYTRDLIYGRTWNVVWNKLFKVSIVRGHNITFEPTARYWEDVPFSISYSLYCNKVAYVHKPLYHYIKTNMESLTATEGINTSFNESRVQQVKLIEPHLYESGKYNELRNDIRWLKFWIKNTFIRYKVDKERMELWRYSFPEVNNEYKQCDMSNNRLTAALVNEQYWYVYMHYYYYQTRHFLKKILTCVMKP